MRLNLRVRGETIVGVESVEGRYCARDISALAEGQPLEDVLPLIERSCASAGGAHRLALCLAVEEACDIRVPRSARLVRTLFAEVERMLARLWLLSSVAQAFGLPLPAREALEQREAIYTALNKVGNFRVYGSVAVPGGSRTDLRLAPLKTTLTLLASSIEMWRLTTSARGPFGRLGADIGVIKSEQAREMHLGGITAASAPDVADLRQTEPYDGYKIVPMEWAEAEEARDVAGRARRAVADIATSLEIASACLAAIGDEPPAAPASFDRDGDEPMEAEARVEGPHGPVTVSCTLEADSSISALEILTPALDLYDALPDLLAGMPTRHLPTFLASVDLCLECVDQ